MSLTLTPAIRGQFGRWEYYITTMKAVDAARTIKSPDELFEVSARALDERMQRTLGDRVGGMIDYLTQPYRFYGPLVVALKGGDPEFIPLEMAVPNDMVPTDAFELGVLRFNGTEDYFVLDGQHRLASIKAALGRGNESVKQDDVSLVIIRHDDTQQGMENSRRLFTHLNRYAKQTSKSENITMDEDDGYAIVTRRLVREHPVLQDKIWYKSRGLPPRGTDDEGRIVATECFTTVETVYNCNKTLLKSKYGFSPDWERIRPEPDQLNRLAEGCWYFWDGLLNFEQIELVASGQRSCPEFRPQDLHQRGEGHLLFRPIGLETLAETVATIMEEEKSGFDGIDQICKRCVGVDWKLDSPPWAGLFFGEGGRMLSSNTRKRQNVGSKLLRYMLGTLWPDPSPLLQEYREVVYPRDPDSPEAKQLELPAKVS